MDHSTITFATPLLASAGIIALIIGGVVAFYGLFDGKRQEQRKDADQTEEKLVKLLKEQVDALERKVDDQASQLEDYKTRLDALEKENQTLRDVLLGKDEESVKRQVLILSLVTDTHNLILESLKAK